MKTLLKYNSLLYVYLTGLIFHIAIFLFKMNRDWAVYSVVGMIITSLIYYCAGKFNYYPISQKESGLYWVGTWALLSVLVLIFNEVISFLIVIVIDVLLLVYKIIKNRGKIN